MRRAMKGVSVSTPDVNPPATVELRVHGVSGTPPEEMLTCSEHELERVAGDGSAGFYRRSTDAAGGASEGGVAEAYSWGGLTSGSATRALWLLLLPFVFVNLAHWMLPPATHHCWAMMAVRLLRVLGLTLTLTFLLAVVAALVDVTAWQCGHLPYCGGVQFGPAGFLADLPGGQRVAIAALPLAFLVWIVLRLGKANPPYYDDQAGSGEPVPEPAVMVAQVPLAATNFWSRDDSVHRLRLCHVTAWNAALGAVVLNAVRPATFESNEVLWSVVLGVNLVCLTLALGAVLSNRATARGGTGCDRLNVGVWWLTGASTLSLVGTLVFSWFARGSYSDQLSALPGLHDTMHWLLWTQLVILVALFVAMFLARRLRDGDVPAHQPADDDVPHCERGYRPTLRGYTAFFVAAIALLAGGGLSAGLVLVTAQFFGDPVLSEAAANAERDERLRILGDLTLGIEAKINEYDIDAAIAVPPAFALAAIVFVVLALLLIVCAAVLAIRIVPRRAKKDPQWSDDDRSKSIARMRAWAWLPDVGVPILACFTAAALVLFFVPFAWLNAGGFEAFDGHWATIYDWLANTAVALLAAAAAGLFAVTVLAFRNRRARRTVGILWDVITFWPRANHPLTPPCYAERAVPDLRVQTRILGGGGPVVLSAHSQGSIIAAAALLLPFEDYDDLTYVALLTHGSPLRRLFGRNFPAYFGISAMQALHRRLPGRWVNMWAATDPIGGWVFTPGSEHLAAALTTVDLHLSDVERLERDERGMYPPICGHSGFRHRQGYTDAVRRLSVGLAGAETPAVSAQQS